MDHFRSGSSANRPKVSPGLILKCCYFSGPERTGTRFRGRLPLRSRTLARPGTWWWRRWIEEGNPSSTSSILGTKEEGEGRRSKVEEGCMCSLIWRGRSHQESAASVVVSLCLRRAGYCGVWRREEVAGWRSTMHTRPWNYLAWQTKPSTRSRSFGSSVVQIERELVLFTGVDG